jgi:2-dehydropantoate 2-reductase
MHIVILGTGAMSCLFGARLAVVAGVTLVGTWAEGIAAIRSGGILLEREGATERVPVACAWLGEPVPPADLVLVLVKAWQTATVATHLGALLAPEGAALTLQNGLGNLERLGPRAHLGVTTQGASLIGPGRVRAAGGGPTHAAAPERLLAPLARAGFAVVRCAPAEAEGLLWGKLVANCAINGPTALLGVPNGRLLDDPGAASTMARAALECAAVAAARGIRLPFADPVEHAREVARLTAANRSSMLQDVLRGAPTECDAIYGAVVREGERLGVPVPVNAELWRRLRRAAPEPEATQPAAPEARGA